MPSSDGTLPDSGSACTGAATPLFCREFRFGVLSRSLFGTVLSPLGAALLAAILLGGAAMRFGASSASMVIPLYALTASAIRWPNSVSSSSSLHSCSGFLAPPLSTFFVTSLAIVSSKRLRADPPAGESQYCFTRTAEKPPTPPKYWNTRSTSSAVCGMLLPP